MGVMIHKIIVECHHAMGDVLMTFPALQKLYEVFYGIRIDFICGAKEQIPLIEQSGIVHTCYVLNVRTDSVLQIVKLCAALRLQSYDLGIALGQSPTGLDVLLLKACGCRQVISLQNQKAVDKNYIGVDTAHFSHRVQQHMACVQKAVQMYGMQPFCNSRFFSDPVRTLSFPDLSRCENRIGLCVGAGEFFYRKRFHKVYFQGKKWPVARWMELAVRLTGIGRKVILFGGKAEAADMAAYQGLIRKYQILDLTGKCTITESIRHLAACSVAAGADTGLMHAAAALDIRTVTLFGPTDPDVIGPYSQKAVYIRSGISCSPCYRTKQIQKCQRRRCMQNISVEMVFQAIAEQSYSDRNDH